MYNSGNHLNITWVPYTAGPVNIVMWQIDNADLKEEIGILQYLPGSSKRQSNPRVHENSTDNV